MAISDPVYPSAWEQLNTLEETSAHNARYAQLTRLAQTNILAGTQQAPPPPPPPSPGLSERARELFLKRMGGIRGEMKVKLGDFVQCHVHADIVYVFFCFSGREGVVKEQIDLFPSDLLISQFRMILA